MVRSVLFSIVMLASAGLLPATSAYAQVPSPGAVVQGSGKIDAINLAARQLVIDDTVFLLSPTVRVFNAANQPVSPGTLRKGMTVKYYATRPASKRGSSTITEIMAAAGG